MREYFSSEASAESSSTMSATLTLTAGDAYSTVWGPLSLLAAPDLGSPPAWLFSLLLLVIVVRFLKVFSYPEKPQITYCTAKNQAKENHRIAEVTERCSTLNEV